MNDSLKSSALAAVRVLLKPVIKIMLKHGVMHREFVDLTKELYVDVARQSYGIRGRPTNVSRTALLTGLDRKEITRVKKKLEGEVAIATTHKQDRISRVLAGWYQDREFLNSQGQPKKLSIKGKAEGSWSQLIKRYGGDVPGITILRELQRVNVARLVGKNKDRVEVLNRNYFLNTEVDPEVLARAGSVLEDLGDTVAHNLYCEREQSRFEARASNTNIPTSALPAYRKFVRGESQKFLERVDAWLSQNEQKNADQKCIRLGLGMYWIQSDKVSPNTPIEVSEQ